MNLDLFSRMIDSLPPIMSRKDIGKFLGNIISPAYLRNLDCEGKGIRRFRIGRTIFYETKDVIDFLNNRIKVIE